LSARRRSTRLRRAPGRRRNRNTSPDGGPNGIRPLGRVAVLGSPGGSIAPRPGRSSSQQQPLSARAARGWTVAFGGEDATFASAWRPGAGPRWAHDVVCSRRLPSGGLVDAIRRPPPWHLAFRAHLIPPCWGIGARAHGDFSPASSGVALSEVWWQDHRICPRRSDGGRSSRAREVWLIWPLYSHRHARACGPRDGPDRRAPHV
jgi:hypothetical protein